MVLVRYPDFNWGLAELIKLVRRTTVIGKCFGMLFCFVSSQTNAVNITLQPDMPALSVISPSTPLSWTSSREECDMQYGMELYSDTDYDWITGPESSIDVTVDCTVEQEPYSVRAVFWDYQGRAVHVEELGDAPCTVPLHIGIHGRGVYMITLDAISTNNVWSSRLVRTVAALPDNSYLINAWRNVNRYTIGSCFFPNRYGVWSTYNYPDMTADEAIDAIASVAQRVGFQAMRVDYKTSDPFETNRMDTFVSILTNHNQKVNFKLEAHTNDLAMLSEWTSNVTAFAEHYQDAAWIFEVGNEPAHEEFFDGDWNEYLTLLSNAYVNIKAAVPSAIVTHGALCTWELPAGGTTRGYSWYTNFISNGALFNDQVAYHFHGTLAGAEELGWISEYKSMYMEAGGENIPWVQTEGGVCLWRAYEDVNQTPYLMQKMFWSWAMGDTGWVQFALFADVSSSWANNSSVNWAIFDEATFCPKFPVGQISAMINRFAGYAGGEVIYENDVLVLIKFSASNGTVALVGFTKDGSEVSGTFAFDASEARLYDPQGNCMATNTSGSINVDFSAYPCWVETTNNIVPVLLDDVDEELVTDVSFEQVLFGTCEWGTNRLDRDLDDSMYNLDSVLRQHNYNVSIENGIDGNGLYIGWRWGGYAEVDLSELDLDISELTISLWAKVNRWDADYYDNKAYWSLLADDGGSISLTTSGGGAMPCLQSYNGGIDGVPYFQSPWGTDNVWKLITVVFSESAGTVKLYLDSSNPLTVSSYDPDLIQKLSTLRIGNRFDDESNSLKGSFDNVRVYSRALSSTEISGLYNEYSE